MLFLYERVNLVAVDLPGHGQSVFNAADLAARCHWQAIVADLANILAHYGSGTGRNVLVAHSYGTSLCCKLYNQLPADQQQRVAGFIFCGCSLQCRLLMEACLLAPVEKGLSACPW